MGLKRALLCVALCVCSALPASAFVVSRDTTGRAVRWPTHALPVRYRIGVTGAGEADEALVGAVLRAFQTWNRAPDSYVRFRYAGRTLATRAAPDGENCVIWVTRGWPYRPETIAYTTTWLDHAGHVIDADVELNAERFVWSTLGLPGAVDVQNAVTHECGHALGLAHSLESTETTMFPIILLGEVLKRSLELDDVAGVRALYPIAASEVVVYEPADGVPGTLQPVLDGLLAEAAGNTASIVLRADIDADGEDEFGVFRAGAGPTPASFSVLEARPVDGEPLPVAYDEWEIPAGGEIEDATAVDVDGDGLEEIVVLQYDADLGSQEVLVYDMPRWGDFTRARAQPPVARDAWRIPRDGNLLKLFALRTPAGELGVVRAGADGALEIEISTPPRRGDASEHDAARGESVPVLLPDGFAFTDLDAADLDGDGFDELVVLDQDGLEATVIVYDLVLGLDGPGLALSPRESFGVPLAEDERALALVGVDLDGLGIDQVGILRATIR